MVAVAAGGRDVDDGRHRLGHAAPRIEQTLSERRTQIEVDDLTVLGELRQPGEQLAVASKTSEAPSNNSSS